MRGKVEGQAPECETPIDLIFAAEKIRYPLKVELADLAGTPVVVPDVSIGKAAIAKALATNRLVAKQL